MKRLLPLMVSLEIHIAACGPIVRPGPHEATTHGDAHVVTCVDYQVCTSECDEDGDRDGTYRYSDSTARAQYECILSCDPPTGVILDAYATLGTACGGVVDDDWSRHGHGLCEEYLERCEEEQA